ncbi:glycyl-radical enzyme activating protein [Lachnospiraceae bacterium ZAX-1]
MLLQEQPMKSKRQYTFTNGGQRTLIGGIQRFSTQDGPGIRTTVFIKGCPLHCLWCHNPELIKMAGEISYREQRCIGCMKCRDICPVNAISKGAEFSPQDIKLQGREPQNIIKIERRACTACLACTKACYSEALKVDSTLMSVDEVLETVRKDQSYYEHSGGGMTLSGGEVLTRVAFALDLINEAQKYGIATAIETSGFGKPQDLMELAKASTDILYDIKHMDAEKHRIYTGIDNQAILKNIRMLSCVPSIRPKITIRVPCIKNINTEDDNMQKTAEYMNGLNLKKIQLIPYHSMGISKARQQGQDQPKFETPTDHTLHHIQHIFKEFHIHAEIMGE